MGTVTFINTEQYRLQPVPEVGKEYHIFDDGKISYGRHYIAKVLEIIPFDSCQDKALLDQWQHDSDNYFWLFAEKTDYFVKAASPNYDDEVLYFARTNEGGWFSIEYPNNSGARLDIDGSLYRQMIELSGKE